MTRALDRALNQNNAGDDVVVARADLLDVVGGSPGQTLVKMASGQLDWGIPSIGGAVRPLPPGGVPGQALAIDSLSDPQWGAAIDGGNF